MKSKKKNKNPSSSISSSSSRFHDSEQTLRTRKSNLSNRNTTGSWLATTITSSSIDETTGMNATTAKDEVEEGGRAGEEDYEYYNDYFDDVSIVVMAKGMDNVSTIDSSGSNLSPTINSSERRRREEETTMVVKENDPNTLFSCASSVNSIPPPPPPPPTLPTVVDKKLTTAISIDHNKTRSITNCINYALLDAITNTTHDDDIIIYQDKACFSFAADENSSLQDGYDANSRRYDGMLSFQARCEIMCIPTIQKNALSTSFHTITKKENNEGG